MAKKKKEEKIELLTKEQEKQLQSMVNGMLNVAADIVKEYDDLDLDDLKTLSGSVTQINQNSPFLDEIFKGNAWKRVIKNMEEKPINPDTEDTEDASE